MDTQPAAQAAPFEVKTVEEVEVMVMQFIDVLDRTRSINETAMKMVPEAAQGSLAKDNEVLLDLRNRLWNQFRPLFVADVVH